MLTIDDRVLAVLVTGWQLMPPIKHQAWITSIQLERLGAKHGRYDPDDGTLTLNADLFRGETAREIRLMDIEGNDPPQHLPCVSRALATWLHEAFHAVGRSTGLDSSDEWLQLSGWVEADDDPQGTARYWEQRPGWGPHGPSEWRHRLGCWFPREYASRSPFECFADCCTHITLGWADFFNAPHPYRANAMAKLRYLRRYVWQETGGMAIAAARGRWQQRLVGVR